MSEGAGAQAVMGLRAAGRARQDHGVLLQNSDSLRLEVPLWTQGEEKPWQ